MSRRRRNPFDSRNALTLLLVGAAGYALYKLWNFGSGAATAVGQGFESASGKVADVLDYFFPHASATFVAGSTVVLSTGQEIPVNQINPSGVGSFTDTDNAQKIQFSYAGHVWRTTGLTPDESNTYYAVQIS